MKLVDAPTSFIPTVMKLVDVVLSFIRAVMKLMPVGMKLHDHGMSFVRWLTSFVRTVMKLVDVVLSFVGSVLTLVTLVKSFVASRASRGVTRKASDGPSGFAVRLGSGRRGRMPADEGIVRHDVDSVECHSYR